MSFIAGARLGPYEIVALTGAGGEVYRAIPNEIATLPWRGASARRAPVIATRRIEQVAGTGAAGQLRYQACNDKACFPPKTVAINLPYPVP